MNRHLLPQELTFFVLLFFRLFSLSVSISPFSNSCIYIWCTCHTPRPLKMCRPMAFGVCMDLYNHCCCQFQKWQVLGWWYLWHFQGQVWGTCGTHSNLCSHLLARPETAHFWMQKRLPRCNVLCLTKVGDKDEPVLATWLLFFSLSCWRYTFPVFLTSTDVFHESWHFPSWPWVMPRSRLAALDPEIVACWKWEYQAWIIHFGLS